MPDSLNGYIREAIQQNPGSQPPAIAELLMTTVPSDNRYLLDLLTSRVHEVMQIDGNTARNAVFAPRRGVTSSPKYADRRNAWQKMLDGYVNVNGEMKRYGACTREDLRLMIKDRNELIGQIQNQIQNHEQVLSWLDQYDVATPDDLPEQAAA
jgi:hypothetical protein